MLFRTYQSKPLGILGALALALTACGLDGWIPETGAEAGEESTHVRPSFDSGGTRSFPAGVTSARIEVLDVLLHKPGPDVWVILNDKPFFYELVGEDGSSTPFSAVPIGVGDYDALQVVFAGGSVATNGREYDATVTPDSVLFEQTFQVRRDSEFVLTFDLSNAVGGNAVDGWTLTPDISVEMTQADFSDEDLNIGNNSDDD